MLQRSDPSEVQVRSNDGTDDRCWEVSEMSIHAKEIPEMVSVTISGIQSKELEEAIRLVIIKANRKRKAAGEKKIPYAIVTVPKHRQCHRSQHLHRDRRLS